LLTRNRIGPEKRRTVQESDRLWIVAGLAMISRLPAAADANLNYEKFNPGENSNKIRSSIPYRGMVHAKILEINTKALENARMNGQASRK